MILITSDYRDEVAEPSAAAVELWVTDLDDPSLPDSALHAVLSPDEVATRDRFARDIDRHRYASGRGFLRHVLGDRLNMNPSAVMFAYGAGGKPELRHPAGPAFNVSRCESLFVVALSEKGPLGVDVELIKPVEDIDLLARHVCTPQERARLFSLAETDRSKVFLQYWTAKESVIKAKGAGLTLEPWNIRVERDLRSDGLRVVSTEDPTDTGTWNLSSFMLNARDGSASPAAVATIAVQYHRIDLTLQPRHRFHAAGTN